MKKNTVVFRTGAGFISVSMCCAAVLAAETDHGAAGGDSLDAIVVTATKQSESLSRVPMSVSALSQNMLDERSIQGIADLAREVPALFYVPGGVGGGSAGGGSTIAIRGVYTLSGAATTGVYLDDVPVQSRFAPGVTASATPLPQLFDLARVEVLRGPQGTLFGGSSEGGAVRFVTTPPSLTQYSGLVRVDGSKTRGGQPSDEVAAAYGGPLSADRLGFRVSVIHGHEGGYLSHISPLTGQLVLHDSNWEDHDAVRGELLFSPVEPLQIMPAFYYSKRYKNDTDDYWSDSPAYTTPALSYGANGQLATAANPAVFTRPAENYPAVNYFGPGRSGDPTNSWNNSVLKVYSLDVNYDFGPVKFTSISAFTDARTTAVSSVFSNLEPLSAPSGLGFGFSGYNSLAGQDDMRFTSDNQRRAFSQELRLSSPVTQRLNFVGGAFYQHAVNPVSSIGYESLNGATLALYGVPTAVKYGIQEDPNNPISVYRNETLYEITVAGFGEANFNITERLKATAGVRVEHESQGFNGCQYGTTLGQATCTTANGLLTSDTQDASPVLPKYGLAYQINDQNLVYFTASKGYRSGGVNTALPPSMSCNAALAAAGGRPETYQPDYVKSYEVGAKLNALDGRAVVNTSVYRIDWQQIQFNVALPGCAPFSFTANAGTAQSQGVDVTTQFRVSSYFTADLNVGYTDAKYTQAAFGTPNPTTHVRSVLVHDGDELPIAPVNASLGLEYRVSIFTDKQFYVRSDYFYQSSYHKTFGPGAVGYAPDAYTLHATSTTNARAGLQFDAIDVSLYLKNVFNAQDVINQSGGNGRTGCTNAACTTYSEIRYSNLYSTYRPREFGVTAYYRF